MHILILISGAQNSHRERAGYEFVAGFVEEDRGSTNGFLRVENLYQSVARHVDYPDLAYSLSEIAT